MTRNRNLFVNLPVRDLEKTKEFFSKLGFEFNAKFTDQNAACMVIGPDAFVMLLVEPFFKTFTKKDVCRAGEQTEALFGVSCDTRAQVDEMVKRALEAGATAAMPTQDHGFMYASSFYDLDGHHWEVIWMDPKALE